ncbi:MAG: DEAD/DEAH box helicase, partial [Thaumarchaeota archaeon]|nr:DEAD/DEAH box helicase [Nitrososphaerota archaeon]
MSKTSFKNFEVFFKKATGKTPYPYQNRLAESPIPSVINVPTGAGKTEAAILGVWLWHRLHDNDIPRRLIYCLPRRVLVEQTKQRIEEWLKNLGLEKEIGIALLLGGEQDKEFDKYPAKDYIIVGTQDVLISGALNRRYGSNPFRWPITFGLLNNDCLWVLDEIQVMENALPTSIQLDAFRKYFKTFGPCHTVWMSATLQPDWLKTVNSPSEKLDVHYITEQDKEHDELKRRNNAVKTLRKAKIELEKKYEKKDIEYLHSLHKKDTVTLIMVNTVKRAQDVYDLFTKIQVDCKLIHSRF